MIAGVAVVRAPAGPAIAPRRLADAVGVSPADVAVLKNNRAKAVRFTTLDAICRVLDCQPGDVLRWEPLYADASDDGSGAGSGDGSGISPGR
ncbi:helix-turn-helix domain-containing protein [Oerskovia rustica]|uniref:Helix-turn-helix domain-containing protein n=1 Tax=Oerskovia rustica TaxID=2762237 RepID=A0ABR8RNV7_9CELL|nr:helix-turn-helix domain-containing protein [Oerskovia rustica]MBD7949453.1 helix-turn-helix domain-containing protein [Oerskovia rustica]